MSEKKASLIFNIDFDGTCVTHEFPEIGKDIGAVPVLKALVGNGHKLILFTMRSDTPERAYLTEAVNWFTSNGIPLYGINTNPTQSRWTSSPKSFANVTIDDSALGCPVVLSTDISDRFYVDWYEVKQLLEYNCFLDKSL